MFCHETVDLTHRQAASPAVPQSHKNENAGKKKKRDVDKKNIWITN